MYTLIRSIPKSHLFAQQLPAVLLSFVIAEAFYKFHSFTLECVAFLATWFALDAVFSLLARYGEVRRKRAIKATL